ncbi:hypothetical protein F4780DRAFT_763925 [Xylariomycetidae sp. FL0641]|nr:hypothetical protein F4780DRAFT_763925 [Xylariomycetidae sp. FL0641]
MLASKLISTNGFFSLLIAVFLGLSSTATPAMAEPALAGRSPFEGVEADAAAKETSFSTTLGVIRDGLASLHPFENGLAKRSPKSHHHHSGGSNSNSNSNSNNNNNNSTSNSTDDSAAIPFAGKPPVAAAVGIALLMAGVHWP